MFARLYEPVSIEVRVKFPEPLCAQEKPVVEPLMLLKAVAIFPQIVSDNKLEPEESIVAEFVPMLVAPA